MADSGPTTRRLTSAMAAGDPDAIASFYTEFFDTMYCEARRASRRDEEFCLDIVQDGMLKVIRSIRPMESEPQLAQWTRKVVRNVAYDRLRGEIRRRHREAQLVSHPLNNTATQELDEMEAQAKWLSQELDSLPASDSRLLNARYTLGWTLHRIGRELGISAGAVDGRLRRLLSSIRHRYKKSQDNE